MKSRIKTKKDKTKKENIEEKEDAEMIISDEKMSENDLRLYTLSYVIRKWLALMLVMTLIFGVCLTVIFYYRQRDNCQVIMAINYEEIINGLSPNETRLNISDFMSEDIMQRAIEKAGLTGKVTSSEIKEHLSVSPTNTRKPSGDTDSYIPTSYRITYKNPDSIKDISSEHMLTLICESYKESFYLNYTQDARVLSEKYEDFTTMEFTQIGAYMNYRIKTLINYLDMRNKVAGKFKAENTGETFGSLKKRAENLKDYSLKSYESFIWENGIVRDPELYNERVTYQQLNNEMDYKGAMNEYKIRNDVIKYYSNYMMTTALIPTIRATEFYMGRTKVGVDYLATEADYYLGNAQSTEKGIMYIEDRTSKLQPSSAGTEQADELVREMQEELVQIENIALETDREYVAQREKNYMTFEKKRVDMFGKKTIFGILLLCFLFFAVMFIEYYKRTEKKIKRRSSL